jgi:hypothetical protein
MHVIAEAACNLILTPRRSLKRERVHESVLNRVHGRQNFRAGCL